METEPRYCVRCNGSTHHEIYPDGSMVCRGFNLALALQGRGGCGAVKLTLEQRANEKKNQSTPDP